MKKTKAELLKEIEELKEQIKALDWKNTELQFELLDLSDKQPSTVAHYDI